MRRAAKVLRAAQCAEGWHLESEPIADPPPPDEVQAMWVEHRAQAQAMRDQAEAAGDDTGELDELIAELDQEITSSGLRGKADPARARPRRPGRHPGRPGQIQLQASGARCVALRGAI
jgi:hypothetical protein